MYHLQQAYSKPKSGLVIFWAVMNDNVSCQSTGGLISSGPNQLWLVSSLFIGMKQLVTRLIRQKPLRWKIVCSADEMTTLDKQTQKLFSDTFYKHFLCGIPFKKKEQNSAFVELQINLNSSNAVVCDILYLSCLSHKK